MVTGDRCGSRARPPGGGWFGWRMHEPQLPQDGQHLLPRTEPERELGWGEGKGCHAAPSTAARSMSLSTAGVASNSALCSEAGRSAAGTFFSIWRKYDA